MNVLIVGFGEMGCRHTQSLLNNRLIDNIQVLEPNEEIFERNLTRIGADNVRVNRINSLDEVNPPVGFAIVATSSGPRFEIMKDLLKMGIPNFLLEKVVFQSHKQFSEIIKLMEDGNVNAHVNFVNRYFDNYIKIKNSIKSEEVVQMVVAGGEFGLGCNALHYIDLFEYLTGSGAMLRSSFLNENLINNKRGSQYREVTGSLSWATNKGDSLVIISDKERKGGVEITLLNAGILNILNEETQTHFNMNETGELRIEKFQIRPTSILTNQIFEDIINNSCKLPTVEKSKNAHTQFLEVVNRCFGINVEDNCPIT